MDAQSLAQRVLQAAVSKAGGAAPLARYLAVEVVVLERWLAGDDVPPAVTLRRAVEIVIDTRGR